MVNYGIAVQSCSPFLLRHLLFLDNNGLSWTVSALDETQTMSHIVESCPQTRLHGGLSKLHSVDDDAVASLTSYGS